MPMLTTFSQDLTNSSLSVHFSVSYLLKKRILHYRTGLEMPAPKILSEGQWKILLDYMEANPIFAKGNAAGIKSGQKAKAENNAQWKRLACRLNDVGTGRSKNYIQWRNYWNNIKYKVRKKACTIRKHMRGTVDGEILHRYYLLTKNEKRVLRSLGIPIPGQVPGMKTVSPTLDASQSSPDTLLPDTSPPDTTPPQSDMSPAAPTPSPEIKPDPDTTNDTVCFILQDPKDIPPAPERVSSIERRRIAAEKRTARVTSPIFFPAPDPEDAPAAPPVPYWVRGLERRRIAAEEKTAQALQGILANTECCVNALQGIQFAQECLNKTMQGIQVALEASARALLERRN